MKNIKVLIIICVVLFMGTIAVIFFNNKTSNETLNVSTINETLEEPDYSNLEKVTGASAFFTVEDCINKYIQYVLEEDNESVLKILDNEYILENKLITDNVIKKVNVFEDFENIEAKEMLVEIIDENTNKYYVKAITKKARNDEEQSFVYGNEIYIAVTLDFENMIYTITPLKNGGMFNEKSN